ncbi:MAG: ornithine--oxo-acid transaminase [Candidatus Carbobacillus altaicus]|uniref:ornithine aminotransferase n=1 Tax=Candidatus Carbonibacillus altaicus TaxID=2163959 RepID=A0A2R6XYC5_9BACL|nr:ornithine--oxo-acid transaminase [Candidatus Carbobacillus altaicus]PTQ55428.1 MAG: Ornithine aminotransferase [Candidatus Carbobacillus altaicus]
MAHTKTDHFLALEDTYGAKNYAPLSVVLTRGEGVWVEDVEGRRYLDFLSAYSALNQGHRHPKIISALKEQADRLTLTSRAFYTDQLALLYEKLHSFTGKERFLLMNSGAEAVETAIKIARRFGYEKRGIPEGMAEIIVAENNFHGRTTTITSFSTEPAYKKGFGPFTPGFKIIPYGDARALEEAITPNTVAFLVEPIQGEAGVRIPPDGYLREVHNLLKQTGMLLMLDEIQTGFGRTGKRFAADWEDVSPDVLIMGKALGGGVFPVSAVGARAEVMDVITPGSHGSTFGGNPLAAAVARAAIEVIEEEDLPQRSLELGLRALEALKTSLGAHPRVKDIRGRGLFIGIELNEPARPYAEQLMRDGVLVKETHETVIRIAPPLIITEEDLNMGLDKIIKIIKQ